MTKKIKKQEANYHIGDIKMQFLSSVVSGINNHLQTPTGNVVFSRLADKKKNDRFRNHILEEFAKRSMDAIENVNHDHVYEVALAHQEKFIAAATKAVNKIQSKGEDFDHHELLGDAFSAFDKVHAKFISKF